MNNMSTRAAPDLTTILSTIEDNGKFPPTDLTSDVVVPSTLMIGLLVINVLVLVIIFRLKRRLPASGGDVHCEMEELGKILPSPDERSRLDAERI